MGIRDICKWKLDLIYHSKTKISSRPIKSVAVNKNTGLLAVSINDGDVVLLDKHRLDVDDDSTVSLQLSNQIINELIWINSHELVTGDSSGSIGSFNVVSLTAEAHPVHFDEITAVTTSGEFLVSGSKDGTCKVMDRNSREVVMTLDCSREGDVQAVVDVEMGGSMLYACTKDSGGIWSWDLRNPEEKVFFLEMGVDQVSMKVVENNLMALGKSGVTKISESLLLKEEVFSEAVETGKIEAIERFNGIIWNDKNTLNILAEERERFEIPDLAGYEIFGSNKFVFYTNKGEVMISSVEKRIKSVYD